MRNPRDPHIDEPGNRLFRNAVRQSKRRTNFSWPLVALAVTVLFTTASAAFYYFSRPGAPSPAAPVEPASPATTSATLAAALTPTPTPSPTPTPEPTAKPKTKSKSSSSESGGKSSRREITALPNKEKVKDASDKKLVEPHEAVSSERNTKASSSSKSGAKAKTATPAKTTPRKAGEAKTVAEPTPRPRFNMRPDSERSANTGRVRDLEEFPAAPPVESAPAAPATAPAKKTSSAAGPRGASRAPAARDSVVATRKVRSGKASAGKKAGGLEGAVTSEAAAAGAPPVPRLRERDLSDHSVEYEGPAREQKAPEAIPAAPLSTQPALAAPTISTFPSRTARTGP